MQKRLTPYYYVCWIWFNLGQEKINLREIILHITEKDIYDYRTKWYLNAFSISRIRW